MNQCVKMVNGIKMKAKLIKTESGYNLFTQGFLKASTENDLINQLNIEEGNIRYHLSKQNCDEIFGVVDVDKLAFYEFPNGNINGETSIEQKIRQSAFKVGFNKAMELNKDKVFTLEDMEGCWYSAHQAGRFEGKGIAEKDWQTFEVYIQSQQQPTEIEVMIEMEDDKDTLVDNVEQFLKELGDKPKLDSEGNLILKKK